MMEDGKAERQEIRSKLEKKKDVGKLGKGARLNYMFLLGQISFNSVYIKELKI